MKLTNFRINNNLKINYFVDKNVFNPTMTSKIIINSLIKQKKIISKYKKILDLGCGSGIIALSIKKIFKNCEIYLSDSSYKAVKLSIKNLKYNKIKNYKIKQSDLLNGWSKEKFDIIINDVSAISSFFKEKKFWYNKFIPCDSGLSGNKNTLKILDAAPEYCKIMIMPLISLSNIEEIKIFFKKKKYQFKVLSRENWPLPDNLIKNHKRKLLELKNKKIIDFKEQFGMCIAYTEVIQINL